MKHLDIHIYGQVQGVSFRLNAQRQAEKLDIGGFARNESDGSVYIEAEGSEETLERFVTWCRSGSPAAEVNVVNTEEAPTRNYQGFRTL